VSDDRSQQPHHKACVCAHTLASLMHRRQLQAGGR
jgi:hypothetical protein